ncbi:MCE family protein [Nocardia beijingensis]|uniref:MCE family protein n=1 Tax=Nocardia beijingensis TaxID=95162 RepID=UPI0018955DF3|nr:MCE family protein [Nocardia beijingensis]MBF6079174.1 MCE family protein [Nocardia beijingensis]
MFGSEALRVTWRLLRLKVAGAALILLVVAVVAVAAAMYAGRFRSTVAVTVETPRSGLVLDTDAKVRMRGVELGTVSAVEFRGDRARLRLTLDPELLRLVPANATVDIRSTTVFGAKYVNFVVPSAPSPTPLRPGATIRAESVTVEYNTLFQRLSDVLAKVEPGELNATLAALDTALRGRGERLADLLARADDYLRRINPSLPALRRDLSAAGQVTGLYADTAPDLLRTAADATATGGTLARGADDLDAVLLNLIGLADTTRSALTDNEQGLTAALTTLRPTGSLLDTYSPVLYCVVTGIAKALPAAEAIIGGNKPGAIFNASFMYGAQPYAYPGDLPKVNATGGPRCDGILDRVPDSHAKYVVTDTNEGAPFTPSMDVVPNAPTVFQILFAGMPGVPR